MADWNDPVNTTDYDEILDKLKARDVDAISLCKSVPTNLVTGMIRYDRSTNKFQEWNGSAWTDLVLAIAGGGTGGSSASAARTALGLDSMATQPSNNVLITGGSISGISIDADDIDAGTLALARGGLGNATTLGSAGTVLQSNGANVIFDALSYANLTNKPVIERVTNITSVTGTSTIAEQDLQSIVLNAGLLSTNGDRLEIFARIKPVSNGDSKRARIYFGSLLVADINSGAITLPVSVYIDVFRITASTQLITTLIFIDGIGAELNVAHYDGTIDLTASVTITTTGGDASGNKATNVTSQILSLELIREAS